jgi:rhodanese-related sulfurtransferase
MKHITVQELQKILASSGTTGLIDVRTPAEFAGIHVPGARSMPLDQLDCGAALAGHNNDTPFYILCHSGARAKRAAEKFAAFGFNNCVVVEGGTQAWANAGLPVERGARTVLPLDRQLQITMGCIVLTGVLLSQFVNHAWVWLSGFVGCGLIFAGVSGICALRMLIARMPWNQAGSENKSCCGAA